MSALTITNIAQSETKVVREHDVFTGRVKLCVPLPGVACFDVEGKPIGIPAGTLAELIAALAHQYGVTLSIDPDREFRVRDDEPGFLLSDLLSGSIGLQRVELGYGARNDRLVIDNFSPAAIVRNTVPVDGPGLGVLVRLVIRRFVFEILRKRSPKARRLSSAAFAAESLRVRKRLVDVRRRAAVEIDRRISEIELTHQDLADNGVSQAALRSRPDYLELAELKRQRIRLARGRNNKVVVAEKKAITA